MFVYVWRGSDDPTSLYYETRANYGTKEEAIAQFEHDKKLGLEPLRVEDASGKVVHGS